MITMTALRETLHGIDEAELEQWIACRWVRPEEADDGYRFAEIDVARIRLIFTLRHDFQIDPGALPIVLSLLDQLYEARRQLMHLRPTT